MFGSPFLNFLILGVERFSTRLIILPVAALLTLGVYELDQHMKKYPQFRHLVWMFAFALAIELGAHSWVWRHAMFISGLPEISFPGGGLHIIDSGIPGFKNRFFAVAIISMVTLAATVYWPVLMQKNGVLANLRKMRD